MGDFIRIKPSSTRTLLKASSGAMKFSVGSLGQDPDILLLSDTYEEIFKVLIGPQIEIVNVQQHNLLGTVRNPRNDNQDCEFYIAWYNGQIQIGTTDQLEPIIVVNADLLQTIGYVRFDTVHIRGGAQGLTIERSPINFKPVNKKKVKDGKLYWLRMTHEDELPPDALIGGFEDGPLYIARGYVGGSICPGKYVPAKRLAFVPWGEREHQKCDFEILCGFNASWISTRGDYIPEHAFVAGKSEIRDAPLYIGRGMHDGYLLNGKVHTLYRTCYLPYRGKEVQCRQFEILVAGNKMPRGVFSHADSPTNTDSQL